MSPRWRFVAVALAVAAATLAVYGPTLWYGFRYDDYFLFRPWSASELVGVWTGSWDPTGISVPFYRPLTSWWYAANFWMFGINSTAMHAVSLAMHAACALLVCVFLRREDLPAPTAVFGSLVYAVHPILVYAQTAWLTNQMHALASLAVVATLILWQHARVRPHRTWLWLILLAAAAFLIKEDTVMLLPALVVLTGLRRWWHAADPGPSWWLLAGATAIVCVLLIAIRWSALGEIGGYGRPGLASAWENYLRGVQAMRLLPRARPWQDLASALATASLILLPVLALAWKRTSRGVYVGTAGLLLALIFNLPFALVSKPEQYHLLGLGAALVTAGVADALWSVLNQRALRVALGCVLALTLVPFAGLSAHIRGDFAPCRVVDTDPKWWVVPQEMQTWMDQKAVACKRGEPIPPLTQLPRISWGVHAPEVDEAGTGFQWTNGQSVFFLRDDQSIFTLWIRDKGASPGAPRRATFTSGGLRVEVLLASPEWAAVTIPVSGRLSWLRGMRKVVLTPDRSFVPHDLDPASPDKRRLALQIRFDPPR